MIDVTILSSVKVVFEGKAKSVILPGEWGVFEVLPFHKPILSRLLKGRINVDGEYFTISSGIVRVDRDKLTAIVEEGEESEP